jgi:hypothetical protein
VIVRRFEAATGLPATLIGTGETFQVLRRGELARRRNLLENQHYRDTSLRARVGPVALLLVAHAPLSYCYDDCATSNWNGSNAPESGLRLNA